MFRRATFLRAPTGLSAAALGITDATLNRVNELIASAKASQSKIAPEHLQRRLHGIDRDVKHVLGCNEEIRLLFRTPEVRTLLGTESFGASGAGGMSSAELIHRTAFSPSATVHGRVDGHVHEKGCSLEANNVSMGTILFALKADKSRPDNMPPPLPCKHCLRRRLNFLASDHFAHGLHWNSVLPTENASNHLSNQAIYQLVRASFGSVRAMEDTLAEFAVNRRDGGFTWLVYNPQAGAGTAANPKAAGADAAAAEGTAAGRLEVVNLPGSTSPVVLGLWPVLCINMTTTTIAATHIAAEAAHAAGTDVQAPSWSRAARNPSSAATRQSTTTTFDATLSDVRRAAATKQCRSLDLAFFEAQTQAAIAYFSSPEYAKATAERRQQLAVEAQTKLAKSFDNVELEAINEMKLAARKAAAAKESERAAKAKAEAGSAATSTAAASADAKKAASSDDAAATASAAAPSEEPAAPVAEKAPEPDGDTIVAQGMCEDGVTSYVTRYNGITSYGYQNGTSTDVYPDGRQISYTPDLTTTTHPDGTVHYLYANGATVEIRPDGTKYVNGELSAE